MISLWGIAKWGIDTWNKSGDVPPRRFDPTDSGFSEDEEKAFYVEALSTYKKNYNNTNLSNGVGGYTTPPRGNINPNKLLDDVNTRYKI